MVKKHKKLNRQERKATNEKRSKFPDLDLKLIPGALKEGTQNFFIRGEMIKKYGTISACARAIGGIEKHDLFNYLAGRTNKVSKERKRLMKKFFEMQGWMKQRRSSKCEVQTKTRMGCAF